jgi:hypothetical protein
MELRQEPPQDDLGGKMLLKMRLLITDMIFVIAGAAKVRNSN